MHPNDTRHISLVCSTRSRTRAKVRAGTTGRVCDEVTNIPPVNAAIRERQRTAVSHSVIPPRPVSIRVSVFTVHAVSRDLHQIPR